MPPTCSKGTTGALEHIAQRVGAQDHSWGGKALPSEAPVLGEDAAMNAGGGSSCHHSSQCITPVSEQESSWNGFGLEWVHIKQAHPSKLPAQAMAVGSAGEQCSGHSSITSQGLAQKVRRLELVRDGASRGRAACAGRGPGSAAVGKVEPGCTMQDV